MFMKIIGGMILVECLIVMTTIMIAIICKVLEK